MEKYIGSWDFSQEPLSFLKLNKGFSPKIKNEIGIKVGIVFMLYTCRIKKK